MISAVEAEPGHEPVVELFAVVEVFLSAPQFVGEIGRDAREQGDEAGAAGADRGTVGQDGLQSLQWDADHGGDVRVGDVSDGAATALQFDECQPYRCGQVRGACQGAQGGGGGLEHVPVGRSWCAHDHDAGFLLVVQE